MMTEQKFLDIPFQLVQSNGGSDGKITVLDATQFKVKQLIYLSSVTQGDKEFVINRILKNNVLCLGNKGKPIADRANLSAFLMSDNLMIRALEQPRPSILPDHYNRAVYAEEPTVAIRSFLVDYYGDGYTRLNPLPSLNTFIRNGVAIQVTEDTVAPENNTPLPVKLTGIQGDVIVNADNLNLEVQSEGEYNVITNPRPDSIGLVSHERGVTQDRTKQTRRITAKRGTVDTDTVSQDISLHDHNGNQFTETNPLNVDAQNNKASYSAAISNLASGLLATDIFTITGSATKTIRVTQIQFSGIKTTSTNIDLILLKRSTANTGGTSTTLTAVPLDSVNAAATAIARAYTVNPTTGTLVGNLRTNKTFINTGTGGVSTLLEWKFGEGCQPIYLRGTSEVLSINLNGVTLAGSSFDIFIEWTEE